MDVQNVKIVEWIFSGIGATIVGLVITHFLKGRRNAKNGEIQVREIENSTVTIEDKKKLGGEQGGITVEDVQNGGTVNIKREES